MSGQDLFAMRDDAVRLAVESNDEARRLGEESARASAEFRKLKALKALDLKARGMAASLVGDAVYADEGVNMARLKADLKAAEAAAAKEAVNLHKRRADICREDIAREWGQSR